MALRPVLPGAPFGLNASVDRPYIAALVTKALAGPAAAAAAAASSGAAISAAEQRVGTLANASVGAAGDAPAGFNSSSAVLPWSCEAAEMAAAVDLQRVLQLCDELGPPADWVR
jgi:hypothetical protein